MHVHAVASARALSDHENSKEEMLNKLDKGMVFVGYICADRAIGNESVGFERKATITSVRV